MKWIEPKVCQISDEILNQYPGTLLLAEQLTARNITTKFQAESFLDLEKYHQQSPFVFRDMEKIVDRINHAIQFGQKIGVWGDFDVDGQTSTALLVEGLEKFGAIVDYHIPIRSSESHGINITNLDLFLNQGINLLITCDTGITEFEALEYAEQAGLDVIVTDHHVPEDLLPPAFAIINPHFLETGHPLRYLAGVGVAYQIMRALFEKFDEPHRSTNLLDLVALGTVADVANLVGENRLYTQMGLRLLNHQTRPSIQTLIDTAGFSNQIITESMISYVIAPRLNAIGRLANANINIEFLLSTDEKFLKRSAEKLEALNNERKLLVYSVLSSCLNLLEKHKELANFPVIILQGKNWEKGVIGIAASRLVELFNKPCILISTDGEIGSGSARSVEGIDIIQAIRRNQDLLMACGGHSMAAGLTIRTEKIDEFRIGIAKDVHTQSIGKELEKKLVIDAYVDFCNLEQNLVDEISLLAPFGPGNPPPVLVTKNLSIVSHTTFGKKENHKKIILQDSSGNEHEAVWWNAQNSPVPDGSIDLAYLLRVNLSNAKQKMQLEFIDYRSAVNSEISIISISSQTRIHDMRLRKDSAKQINELLKRENLLYWGEGLVDLTNEKIKNRYELVTCTGLVILSAPPDTQVFKEILDCVKPLEIFLFNERRISDFYKDFLKTLSGLIRYAINKKDGLVSIKQIAGKMGHLESTILTGLEWWQAHGDIIFSLDSDMLALARNQTTIDSPKIAYLTRKLKSHLAEKAAFQSYYQRTDPYLLINSLF